MTQKIEHGQVVRAVAHILTNTPGYYTIPGEQYRVTRTYSESVEIRGNFTNRKLDQVYSDRMHSVSRGRLRPPGTPNWVLE